VLVAKSAHMRSILMQMHRDGDIIKTFRVICHGAWLRRSADDAELASSDAIYDSSSSIPVDVTGVDAVCINAIHVVKVTPSNEAGSLSTLEINPCLSSMGINVRRYLMSVQHPAVGDSGNTKPLKANRNKGLMLALVRMEFIHPKHQTPVVVSIEEPVKFEQLRNREEKAYLHRQASDMEELRKGGLEPTSAYSRLSERPIAYMVGEKDFCNMRFKVSPATLIPRSSTETLVQAAISLAQDRPVKILDVGTGSGCLLLALLRSLSSAIGVGVDISKNALQVAETNSVLHDLADRATFQLGDMGHLEDSYDLRQCFDILVCNPPYLDNGKAAKLTKLFAGTEFEPPVALFAEKEGYGAYELLAASLLRDLKSPDSRRIMAKGGRVVLEIGSGMGPRVREIFEFLEFEVGLKDKQDSERCLVFNIPSLSLEESAPA
ncbi:S-adenosyl-L-methionine-dependent methyltransferase, partial [Dissophora ornata]